MEFYNFKTTHTKNFSIGVDNRQRYGYFEHKLLGENCGGGLWFDSQDRLLDYDGVYELPREVINELLARGYNLDHIL